MKTKNKPCPIFLALPLKILVFISRFKNLIEGYKDAIMAWCSRNLKGFTTSPSKYSGALFRFQNSENDAAGNRLRHFTNTAYKRDGRYYDNIIGRGYHRNFPAGDDKRKYMEQLIKMNELIGLGRDTDWRFLKPCVPGNEFGRSVRRYTTVTKAKVEYEEVASEEIKPRMNDEDEEDERKKKKWYGPHCDPPCPDKKKKEKCPEYIPPYFDEPPKRKLPPDPCRKPGGEPCCMLYSKE